MSPPIDAAVSTAAACTPGRPWRFMSGMVKLPVTAVLAAPLPLTMPIDRDDSTAVNGMLRRDRPEKRWIDRITAVWAVNPLATAASSRNAAIRVRAIGV